MSQSAEEEQSVSALLDHCRAIYKAMEAESVTTPSEGCVYTGHLTHLFIEVGLGQPYYTAVTRKLKSMDCIRMIKRGGSTAQSKWLLLQEPSESLFALPDVDRARAGHSQGGKAMYEQQLRDMNSRLSRLEAWARNQGYR